MFGHHHDLVRCDCLQPHYSLVNRAEYERELEPVCLKYGLGVIPYSPLGGGFLTGKYHRGQPPPPDSRGADSPRIQGYMTEKNWALLDKLQAIGRARGKSISQVALAWLLNRPGVTSPIIGPRTIDQYADNMEALKVEITDDDRERIDRIIRRGDSVAPFYEAEFGPHPYRV